jgi:hypothetical protein
LSTQSPTAIDLSGAVWRKSTRTQANGECVEIAHAARTYAVRDSKNPQHGTLTLAGPAWRSFITETKNGRYDI